MELKHFKKFITIFIVFSTVFCIDDIEESLKSKSFLLYAERPEECEKYIEKSMTSISFEVGKALDSNFEAELREIYKIREEAIEKFVAINSKGEKQIRSFAFSLKLSKVKIVEYLGFARKAANEIKFGFIEVSNEITLNQLFEEKEIQKCENSMFAKNCQQIKEKTKRNYLPNELEITNNCQKADAFAKIGKALFNMPPEYLYKARLHDIDFPFFFTDFNIKAQTISGAYSEIAKAAFGFDSSENGLLFDELDFQFHQDLESKEQFLDYFIANWEDVSFINKTRARVLVSDYFNGTKSSERFNIFSLVNGKLKYSDCFLKFSKDGLTIFQVTAVKTIITSAQALIIANNFESNKNYIVVESDYLASDLFVLKEMLFRQISSELNEKMKHFHWPYPQLHFLSTDPFELLKTAINPMSAALKQMVNFIKTKTSIRIKETIKGKGYTFLDQSAFINVIMRLDENKLDKFIEVTASRTQMPEDKKEIFKARMLDISFCESSVWSMFDTMFSDPQGNVRMVSLLAIREVDDKIDMVVIDIKATFELAPDILIIEKKISVLGGIFSESQDLVKLVPRSVTEEDIRGVMKFYQVGAFKAVARHFNMQLEVPNLDI